MASLIPETGRLDGWKAISDYLGWHERTVMRWEQQRGLPIHRVPGGQRHAVFAYRHELDEWLKSGHFDHCDLVEIPELSLDTIARVNPTSEFPTRAITHLAALLPGASALSARLRLWPSRRKVIWVTICIALMAVVWYTVHSLAFPPQIKFTGVLQLTHDGAMKDGLATDGRTIYFGEYQNSRVVLAAVSAGGGPVRTIPTPFAQVIPTDVSPDGKNLLVLAREGIEDERSLWIVPVAGGQPLEVGGIRCHAAVWSPDGRRIAFAAQNTIYTTANNGASIQKIQSFDATPEYLLWSPDERRIRFELHDPKNADFSLWELTFNEQDKTQVSSLVPMHAALQGCWAKSMTLDNSGRSFVGGGECGNEKIYLLKKYLGPWNSHFELLETNSIVHNPGYLALDPGSEKVFAIGDYAGPLSEVGMEHLDLVKFDRNSHEYQPFLPGITAGDVDFSRDGSLIAYIRVPEQTLWISHSDGIAARQLEVKAGDLELPRWSPDGKWLAFMSRTPGKPWRIFVVSANGGKPREASLGTDNQGAPTWSPDGKWLVYGNVECQESGTCAIHKINISTGQEYSVPSSEGLGTARWSPNGRYIAALHPILHEIFVLDLGTQQWRKLAEGVNGNDLSWSADSRYIYASKPAGSPPEILRISLKDAKAETAVDLRSFAALTGRIDTWFTLAPDGSIIFSRQMGANEVYSLSYSDR